MDGEKDMKNKYLTSGVEQIYKAMQCPKNGTPIECRKHYNANAREMTTSGN